jgi:hypothetical protein
VYALDASTGAFKWSYTTGSPVQSSPAVSGGVVYVGSDDDNVYALDASTGAFKWSYTTGSPVQSSPAVSGGVVYVGSSDDNVYALDASTGALKWSYTTGDAVASSPAVSGGVVYVGSSDDNVYALDASTGAFKWSYTTGSPVQSSPAVSGGVVYVGSDDWKVYAFGPPGPVGPPGPGYYSVNIYVKDATSGRAIEGAQVFFDGSPRGYSNVMGMLTVTGVGPGTHQATASMAGYSAPVVTFYVTRSTSVTVPLTSNVATYTVTLQVQDVNTLAGIPNAMVYIDGAYAGTTNSQSPIGQLSLAGVRAGTHTFTVVRSGYITWTKPVTLTAPGPWTVPINLTPR